MTDAIREPKAHNPSVRNRGLVSTHPSRIIRPKDAADMLGTTPRALRDWAKRGIGPPRYRLGPNVIGYRLGELEEWIAAQQETVGVE